MSVLVLVNSRHLYNQLKASYPAANFNILEPATNNNLLLKALSYKHEKIAEFLIKEGLDVNPVNHRGNNCLHVALSHYSLVRFALPLLDRGAAFDKMNSAGKTAWMIAKNRLPVSKFIYHINHLKKAIQSMTDKAQGNHELVRAIEEYIPMVITDGSSFAELQDFTYQIKNYLVR